MTSTVHPEVLWAQRSSDSDAEKNFVYLTLIVPDVAEKDMKLDLQPTKLSFKGHSQTKNVDYAVDLDFFGEVDPAASKINHSARDVEMVLRKKELKEEYWPRLLKEKAKVHFLKTDFEKWVDEDEQDAQADEDLMGGMGDMGAMGGMGGMGGGMGGFGGDGGFGNIDFSKLGAAGGLGADLPEGSDEEELPSDDEEMPGLEGDAQAAEKDAGAGATSKKIEEVE